jgi:hypothetical protein
MERHHYRAYLLNKANGIERAIDLFCADDNAARSEAEQLVDGCDVELWQGERKIIRLSHKE